MVCLFSNNGRHPVPKTLCLKVRMFWLFLTKFVKKNTYVNSVIVTFELHILSFVCRDSVVGKATRYELEGLGIKSRWMRDFPHLSGPALVLIQPRVLWASGLFAGGELASSWRWRRTRI